MKTRHPQMRWCAGFAFLLALALSNAPAIAQVAVGTGAFPRVGEIEKNLRRGVSTKADVQRVLGVPNGAGGALLPGFGDRSAQLEAYQVWFYHDVEITNAKSETDLIRLNMRQQILAVFFKGEAFHGYFWTSNGGTVEAGR